MLVREIESETSGIYTTAIAQALAKEMCARIWTLGSLPSFWTIC